VDASCRASAADGGLVPVEFIESALGGVVRRFASTAACRGYRALVTWPLGRTSAGGECVGSHFRDLAPSDDYR
jgi:hypothetical protein